MAQNQTQQTQKPAPKNAAEAIATAQAPAGAGGKPPKPTAKTPEERAKVNLQYSVNRANNYIHDSPTASYARRARAAARAGIEKSLVLKGFESMKAAIADCEKAIERAYSEPTKQVEPAGRVQLI